MPVVCLGSHMPYAVAVRADERTLVGFAPRSVDGAEEATEGEGLCPCVQMMEFQRAHEAVVAAVLAPAAALGDQLRLDLGATTSAVVDPRLQAASAGSHTGPARAVVGAEWRTLNAEPAAAQNAQLAVDEHSERERDAARGADLHTTMIGTPLRTDPAPWGGLEPPTWRLHEPPDFPGARTISSP